ncbi:hypothetical protein [Adhaeribacter pallidiroseus]|uniref:hypothetical protein n=1 Tax=Adhaeribacter pallidiroseus TaxID=2072847 RepID=UPI0011C07853|nr:hypothetical protein [Adhaeribacter pallidiroseus]
MSGDDFLGIVLSGFILVGYYSVAGLAYAIMLFNPKRYILVDLFSYLICLIAILISYYQWLSSIQFPLYQISLWLLIVIPFFLIIFKNIRDRILKHRNNSTID